MRRILHILFFLVSALAIYGQGPNGSGTYYQTADGLKAKDLKTALFNIIFPHKILGYNDLWTAYKTTDVTADGYIWDMYSDVTHYTPGTDQDQGSHSKEGDTYNREHSMPKSWFGDQEPMYTDLFHIVPTDSYVNGMRSNYPYGEVGSVSYSSNNGFSKLGTSSLPGYSGTVFEPNDQYKGDFARNYFYMATAYQDKIVGFTSVQNNQNGTVSDIFSGDSYSVYVKWTLDMLLRWAHNDPVSTKEVNRNSAVYAIQRNRNPFIDYPGLEQYIWGGMEDHAFSYNNYDTNITWSDIAEVNYSPDPDPTPDPPVTGENLYRKVTSSADMKAGDLYIVVCEKYNKALSDFAGKYFNGVNVSVSNSTVTTATGTGYPHQLKLGGSSNAWTLYDVQNNAYLAKITTKNAIDETTDATAGTSLWSISFSDGNAAISNNGASGFSLKWNNSSPRFTCYTSSMDDVQLYRYDVSASIKKVSADDKTGYWLNVYSLDGRLVKRHIRWENAFDELAKGVYIIDHQKFVVR